MEDVGTKDHRMHSLVIRTFSFLIITSVALFHLKRIPIAFIIIYLDKHFIQGRRILFYLAYSSATSQLHCEHAIATTIFIITIIITEPTILS